MRLIMHQQAKRVRFWDAETGAAVPVSTVSYQSPPLFIPHSSEYALHPPVWQPPVTPSITVTLTDGSAPAVEHIECWLGRIGWRQRFRLAWARLTH